LIIESGLIVSMQSCHQKFRRRSS